MEGYEITFSGEDRYLAICCCCLNHLLQVEEYLFPVEM